MALMAVKTKEELEEQAIAIEPSGECRHYWNKLVIGGASGTFPAQRGRRVLIKCKNRRFQSLYSTIYGETKLINRVPVIVVKLENAFGTIVYKELRADKWSVYTSPTTLPL